MRQLLLGFIVFTCFQCASEKSGNIDESLVGQHIIWAEEKGFESFPADRQTRRKAYRSKYPTLIDLSNGGNCVFTYSNGKQEKGKWKAEDESFEIYDVQVGSKGEKYDKNQFEGKYTANGKLKEVLVFKNSKQKIYLQRVK